MITATIGLGRGKWDEVVSGKRYFNFLHELEDFLIANPSYPLLSISNPDSLEGLLLAKYSNRDLG